MDEVIKLGEQIELYGFQNVDRGAMVILRKLIGNAVRSLAERYNDFQKIIIKLEGQNPLYVTTELHTAAEPRTVTAEGTNVFFTLNQALKQL